LVALDAPGGELLLVAGGAVNVVVSRNKASSSDGVLAGTAAETFVVPLVPLVLHLLGACTLALTCPEDLSAAIAARGEGSVVAGGAVHLLRLGPERLIHQGHTALAAEEASLVPMLLLVRQILREKQNAKRVRHTYLGVDSDGFGAFFARVGEDLLVAADAVGMLVSQHVPLARQGLVTLPTAEVARMPVLVHGFRYCCPGSPASRTHLVAGGAPGLEGLGVVSLAVEVSVLGAVRQVHQEFLAGGAHEAGRVPRHQLAELGRDHGQLSAGQHASALEALLEQKTGFHGEGFPDVTDVEGDLVASVHEVLEAPLALPLQELAVRQRQVLLGQLHDELSVPVLLPRRAQAGDLVVGQLREVLLDLRT
ncbi:unnamed protein product, partial [Ixodes hexagonus]